ncbi:VWA domain-containing protein [Marinivivus vitaminiproducens]|uniref:VWA domain-containing protein n=1 Tax=Marinivivus vitaminiproducens TaxID=3035935 RepID=UPI0027A23DAC|nr:VWA domain-containing protein [Geminicoccaceae bacterium SCSIO 64248]
MSDLLPMLDAFHFIRPLWLLLVPLIALTWYRARHTAMRPATPAAGIAPHLREALTVGATGGRRLRPIDGVAAALTIMALAAAGPTWSRVPDPFVAQTAPVVIALKVTDSMLDTDVAPSRLERAKQKIRDLLAERAGARTGLVAYAGSAHVVVPMTGDAGVMEPYLEGLSPDVMPEAGADATAAVTLAQSILAKEVGSGGILLVLDALEPSDVTAVRAAAASGIALLAMLPAGANDPGMADVDAEVVEVTPGDGDVRSIERSLNAAYRRADAEHGSQPWDDRGWLLAWPAALLTLLWFRRGWTMRWAVVLGVAMGSLAPGPARAEGIADWFLTPDQQGSIAYRNNEFERAALLFVDPMWKGHALYHAGKYEEAARVFGRIATPAALFMQGLALVHGRNYGDAITAFQTVVDEAPDYPGAQANLETSKAILAYLVEARAQSDTGEEAGVGADEVVRDDESDQGAPTQIQAPGQDSGILSAEQWMNTVDTGTGDFLRQRFAIEAARR